MGIFKLIMFAWKVCETCKGTCLLNGKRCPACKGAGGINTGNV